MSFVLERIPETTDVQHLRIALHDTAGEIDAVLCAENEGNVPGYLSKYLEEGKAFYNVVLPKLQRLLQNVEDLSTRLTIARIPWTVPTWPKYTTWKTTRG